MDRVSGQFGGCDILSHFGTELVEIHPGINNLHSIPHLALIVHCKVNKFRGNYEESTFVDLDLRDHALGDG